MKRGEGRARIKMSSSRSRRLAFFTAASATVRLFCLPGRGSDIEGSAKSTEDSEQNLYSIKQGGPAVKEQRFDPHRSLYRFLTVILPRSSQELDRWQQRALYAGRPLSQQALDSFSKNHLCLKGGSYYALYSAHPLYEKKLVTLTVALQVIGSYLGNLCEQGSVFNEAAHRYLYRAVPAALMCSAAKEYDYYRFYPAHKDGGYLKALIAECRSCIETLPGYRPVEPEILRLASLYSDLQVYKRFPPAMRRSRLRRWFKEKAAPVDPPLHWWEYAAACGSTLSLFALLALATSPQVRPDHIRQVGGAYFPWVCGLHILLEHWVGQGEDLRCGALNMVACYPSEAAAVDRIHLFLRKALREVSVLPHGSFHRFAVQGLLALYLSDPRVKEQGRESAALPLLQAGGRGAHHLYRLSMLMRRLGFL